MKKKLVFIIVALLLAINLGAVVYHEGIAKSFRYATPAEAFEKSSPRNSEMVDIVEDKDVALVVYKRKDGAYSESVTAKDSRGWTPLSVNYKNKRQITQDDGFFYLKEVQGKNVVLIVTALEAGENLPNISDNVNSAFHVNAYECDSGRKILYGFLVSEEQLPDDYKIIMGNDETALN